MYTALVLDDASKNRLKAALPIPSGWDVICHHMTINMGPHTSGPAADLIGKTFNAKARYFSSDGRVMAVAVVTDCPSKNRIKHITVAVNRAAGGKPVMSNNLTEWDDMPNGELDLTGVVEECG